MNFWTNYRDVLLKYFNYYCEPAAAPSIFEEEKNEHPKGMRIMEIIVLEIFVTA